MTSADTYIRQLRLRGGGTLPGAGPARQVQAAIVDADWPDAGAEAWVFIRQLRVQGPARLLPERLLQATRHTLQGGSDANCVRFATLAELLAALLTDLRQGRRHWYWQHWSALFSQARPAALSQLLAQHPDRLPSVCAHLDRARQLLPLWQALDDTGATRLLAELSWHSGLALPDPAHWPVLLAAEQRRGQLAQQLSPALPTAPQAVPAPPAQRPRPPGAQHAPQSVSQHGLPQHSQPDAQQPVPQNTRQHLQQQTAGTAPALPPHLQQRWGPLLADLPRASPRYLLALLLAAREAVPLMLQQAPLAALVRLEARLLQDRQPATRPAPSATAPRPPAQVPPRQPGTAATAATAAAARGTATTPAPAAPAEHRAPAMTAPHAAALRPAAAAVPDSEARGRDFVQVDTAQGGLLFLLNLLNRAEARSLMRDGWELLPHGWAWLCRLGLELGLDTRDPLAEAIALQLGLDSGASLTRLPALPGRALLLTLVNYWYGGAGVWQPALLARTAQVRLSPSHVDMTLALAAVQLPVRLAGLDINPGWLPWLGKVVEFHYD